MHDNTTSQAILRTKLRIALSDGINIGLACSTGDYSEETELYSVGKLILLLIQNSILLSSFCKSILVDEIENSPDTVNKGMHFH